MKRLLLYSLLSYWTLLSGANSQDRRVSKAFNELDDQLLSAPKPFYCLAEHSIGALGLGVTNRGTFGDYYLKAPERFELCHFGEFNTASGEYPRGSGVGYLSAATLWIGAVIGRDTLVSTSFDGWFLEGGRSIEGEMHPDAAPNGAIAERGTLHSGGIQDNAVSLSYTSSPSTTDTLVGLPGMVPDYLSVLMHVPLGLKVEQRTLHAWS